MSTSASPLSFRQTLLVSPESVQTTRWMPPEAGSRRWGLSGSVRPDGGALSRGLAFALAAWEFWDRFPGPQNVEVAMNKRAQRRSTRSLFDPAVTAWTHWDESLRARVVDECAQLLAAVYRARRPQQEEKAHER